ncbi:OmpA family protein [Candidatus Parabeggiatoa sp. HSG14]|uniref:OmpA family protein n=1 Tax=Candidatus Parabeggiatoa sp. HSG14 TaxID=3055593 RepID=UPI0025A7A23B|nr:OmpA family protein [Thiotrichales bacterium HSG14]
MKKLIFIAFLLGGFNFAYAETTLPFPTTEADIVQALTPKPTSKLQRKGLGSKGIAAIREDNPKIGALILFDFDSAEIDSDSHPLLREFANALQGGLSDVKIAIAGHTDAIGTEAYNLDLSEHRAQSVKAFLVSAYNIAENRLTIKALGESQPIESNDTEEGRTKNRRVEFIRVGD